ncbi:MAG: tetratricopeptide repeat protein [Elusimicrobiota bacterium]
MVIRLVYLCEIRNNTLLTAPVADAKIYYEWAWHIVNTGELIGQKLFFLNPGYPYLLALIFWIMGPSNLVIPIIQFVVGSISAVIVYLIAKETFNQTSGIISGLLYSCYSVFIFYEGLFSTFVWINILNLIAIFLLIKLMDNPKIALSVLIGIILGLSSLFRPNILLYVPLVLIWFILYQRKWFVLFAYLLFGLLVILSPVIVRNYIVFKQPYVSSVSSGINFYLGNNIRANGSNSAMFGASSGLSHPEYMLDYFYKEAEKSIGKQITYSEMNSYWFNKGLSFIVNNPFNAMNITVKKLLLFINVNEIPSNYPFHLFKSYSKILAYLPNYIIIAPFSLFMFIFIIYHNDAKSNLLRMFLAVNIATIMIFFMLSEYRLPAIPIIIVFVSYTFVWFIKQLKQKCYRNATIFIVFSIFFALLSHVPLLSNEMIGDYYWKGIFAKRRGDIEGAKRYFLKGIAYDAASIHNYQQLGSIYYETEDYIQAKYWFEKSLEIAPNNETLYNLGSIYFVLKDYKNAKKYYSLTLKEDSKYVEAMDGLACTEFKMGNHEMANSLWKRAFSLAADPDVKKRISSNIDVAKHNKIQNK